MSVPSDFECWVQWQGHKFQAIHDFRLICPYCRNASAFDVKATEHEAVSPEVIFRLIVQCGYGKCRRQSLVQWKTLSGAPRPRSDGEFFIYPSRATGQPHPSIPKSIGDDWREALTVAEAGATKAAAMMFRRVLYAVLLDTGCTMQPLHKGLKDPIEKHRLPRMFDEWFPAIRNDGNDAAHPERALDVPAENILETRNYTAELLRYVYIEPYDFQERQKRIANPPARRETNSAACSGKSCSSNAGVAFVLRGRSAAPATVQTS